MRLWKKEFYKITARPFLNVGAALMLGFLLMIFWQEVAGTRTEIDGKVYIGLEAIKADRSLAKEYEGIFTLEKAQEIIDRFGFAGFTEKDEYRRVREGNFCNQFVTDNLTDFRQTEEKPEGFVTGEQWENNAAYYMNGTVRFGYIAGWEWMQEVWRTAILILNLWLILMTAPVFSEEYSRNTAGILLTTEHGKARDVHKKVTAALGLGVFMYFLVTAVLFLMTTVVYGNDGLNASAALIIDFFWISFQQELSVGNVLGFMFLEGMAAVILNIGIILFISSKCKNTVSAVIAGVLLYLSPYLVNEVLFHMLIDMGAANYFLGWILLDIMRIFCCSMPLYLPWLDGMNLSVRWRVFVLIIVVFLVLLSIWRACVNYRSYQVK